MQLAAPRPRKGGAYITQKKVLQKYITLSILLGHPKKSSLTCREPKGYSCLVIILTPFVQGLQCAIFIYLPT